MNKPDKDTLYDWGIDTESRSIIYWDDKCPTDDWVEVTYPKEWQFKGFPHWKLYEELPALLRTAKALGMYESAKEGMMNAIKEVADESTTVFVDDNLASVELHNIEMYHVGMTWYNEKVVWTDGLYSFYRAETMTSQGMNLVKYRDSFYGIKLHSKQDYNEEMNTADKKNICFAVQQARIKQVEPYLELRKFRGSNINPDNNIQDLQIGKPTDWGKIISWKRGSNPVVYLSNSIDISICGGSWDRPNILVHKCKLVGEQTNRIKFAKGNSDILITFDYIPFLPKIHGMDFYTTNGGGSSLRMYDVSNIDARRYLEYTNLTNVCIKKDFLSKHPARVAAVNENR